MYNFTFHRPTTVRQAAGLLSRNPEAKLLAGGHSLLPVMKQRLAQPSAIVDLALVGVFVSKRGPDIRVAVTGAGANGVFRVKSFEEALKKRFSPKSIEGMSIPATGMNADIHGSAEYRAHLVGVLARRALAKATA